MCVAAASMMFAVIEVPSALGLRPSGVENLPAALRAAGLHGQLQARLAAVVQPAADYDAKRSVETGVLNGASIHNTSWSLARAVDAVLRDGDFPIVLAGDCSVILGSLLGTKLALRSGGSSDRTGLLFVDGHVDFYQPDASPTGEVADMDLAIATGRGPAILAGIDGGAPLVREEDVAAVGARDGDERAIAGSEDIRASAVSLVELPVIRERGIEAAAAIAFDGIASTPTFWCHVDADVLDDATMPAVDYRQPGGLTPAELTLLLQRAVGTGRMAGFSVAIYNPALDPHGECARVLVDTIVAGLTIRAQT